MLHMFVSARTPVRVDKKMNSVNILQGIKFNCLNIYKELKITFSSSTIMENI